MSRFTLFPNLTAKKPTSELADLMLASIVLFGANLQNAKMAAGRRPSFGSKPTERYFPKFK